MRNFVYFLFVAIVLGLFLYQTKEAPFYLDSKKRIENNKDIRSFENPVLRYFQGNDPSRPLVYASYALNYKLSKLDPLYYRVSNFLVHFFNTFILFYLLSLVNHERKESVPHHLKLLFLSLFTFHPVGVLCSQYIFKRSELFFVTFSLIGISSFLRLRFVQSLGSQIVAFLSRQTAVIFPVFSLLFFVKYKKSELKNKNIVIFFLISIVFSLSYLIYRKLVLGGVGDLNAQATMNSFYYFFNFPIAIGIYFFKLFVPHNISLIQLYPLEKSSTVLICAWIALFLILTGIWRLSKNYLGMELLFLVTGLLITLVPLQTFFPTTTLIDDNRIYFATIFLPLFFLGMYREKKIPNLLIFSCLLLVVSFIAFSFKLSHSLSSPLNFWSDRVRVFPNNSNAYLGRAIAYFEKEDLVSSEKDLVTSLELDPLNTKSWKNLAVLNLKLKRPEQAIFCLNEFIKLTHKIVDEYYLFGVAFFMKGDREKGRDYLRKQLNVTPNHNLSVDLLRKHSR